MVLAHTRWASMGVISEENTHPLDSRESTQESDIVALGALNGDIDNHSQLRTECEIDRSITTDAKLIPVLYSHERELNPTLDSFPILTERLFRASKVQRLLLSSLQIFKMSCF